MLIVVVLREGFGFYSSGFMGLIGYGCRYCKLRCSIVAMCHGHVISCFIIEVLVWHVCGVFVIVGGTGGVYVRCSVCFCYCNGVGEVVMGCMVCAFDLDLSWGDF